MTYMAYIYNNVSNSTITYLKPDEGLHVQHPSLIADLLKKKIAKFNSDNIKPRGTGQLILALQEIYLYTQGM